MSKNAISGAPGSKANQELIMVSLNERMDSLLEALFAFWSNKRSAIPADVFYQKMTTFGLAPNLKFIEDIMNIINFNRPKKIQKSPTRDSVSPDIVGRRNLSQSNISASILASS